MLLPPAAAAKMDRAKHMSAFTVWRWRYTSLSFSVQYIFYGEEVRSKDLAMQYQETVILKNGRNYVSAFKLLAKFLARFYVDGHKISAVVICNLMYSAAFFSSGSVHKISMERKGSGRAKQLFSNRNKAFKNTLNATSHI